LNRPLEAGLDNNLNEKAYSSEDPLIPMYIFIA
jgi:hypothetical protein